MATRMSPQEAAALIQHHALVGFSGFTAAGAPKAVPRALAERARAEHAAGKPYALRVLCGASAGEALDSDLVAAEGVSWRCPYQSSKELRERVNDGRVAFTELHLSHLGPMVEQGWFGRLDAAVVEAVEVTDDGRIYLSTSSGATPSFIRNADKVIVELNRHHHPGLASVHDVAVISRPPRRYPIPIRQPLDKIGTPFIAVDPDRIVGVVETNEADGVGAFAPPDEAAVQIAGHVLDFIASEMRSGRIPPEFLPVQAGVGNVSNAVMAALGNDPRIPPFAMYTEVMQDSVLDLLEAGRVTGVSTSALTLTDKAMQRLYGNFQALRRHLVLRPSELSNSPEVIRRLGLISLNTVIEFDIYGCANSTHVCGTKLMNGIGGSGDFERNAFLPILMTPSVAKRGAISSIVPMVSHVDHNEHSVQIVVTEQGLADLRGLGPAERARTIIDTCAHPVFREYLHDYVDSAPAGHIRHDLSRCFEMHRNFLETGSMLPGVRV